MLADRANGEDGRQQRWGMGQQTLCRAAKRRGRDLVSIVLENSSGWNSTPSHLPM